MSSTPQQPHSPPGMRRLGGVFITLLFFALLIGTLATFFAKQHWTAEIFCHLRIQITIGLAICLLLAVVRKQKTRVIAAAVFLLVNMVWIAPYFLPPPNQPDAEGTSVKILSANVLASNDQYDLFVKTLRQHNPDIAVIVEVTQRWHDKIADALSEDYPHQHILPQPNPFGIGIISKLPFESIEPIVAADTELVSLDARFMGPTGRRLRLIATHPYPPLSQRCFETRSQQLIALAQRMDPAEDNIVAGDFNLTPWSPIFSEVLAAGDLKDSRVGFGIASTWYAFPNFLGSLHIDHVLTSQSLKTISHEVSGDYGSDHRAVIVEIQQLETAPGMKKRSTPARPASPVAQPGKKTNSTSTNSTPTVSIVYSLEYLIDLGGMEKMRPFDIRKYEKIYNALREEDLVLPVI